MADLTSHYGLTTLGPNESFGVNGYAFVDKNIDRLDYIGYMGAEGHHHDGAGPALDDPAVPLQVTLLPGEGNIPGGRTVRYKFTWVDAQGAETAASPEITLNTPAQVATPGTPSITQLPSGGTLLAGNYFYVLTAYTSATTLETIPGARAYTTIISGTTNRIQLTLPTLPNGALGFNLYRRSPGSTRFQYLASIDMDVATPPSTYIDDGGTEEDCNRTVPQRNNTSSSNGVLISLPGATPVVPDDCTWKIYRTYTSGDWDSSLMHWSVEETSEGSGIIITSYTDVGAATTQGTPPDQSELVGSPSKVVLGEETEGSLPSGSVVTVQELILHIDGPVTAGTGQDSWVCPFDYAEIIAIQPYMDIPTAAPTGSDILLEVQLAYAVDTSTYYNTTYHSEDMPYIPLGSNVGSRYEMGSNTIDGDVDRRRIDIGDMLRLDVLQEDESGSPTAAGVRVSVLMFVISGPETAHEMRPQYS